MYRRSFSYTERDHGVVKWALIAATVALTLGFYAEQHLAAHDSEATAVAGESVEAPPVGTVKSAS